MEVINNLCQATQRILGSCFRSTLNRFASADTIVPNPANPQSYNRYSYVENNPINFNDPSGHCKPGQCLVVGGQAGMSATADVLQVAGAYLPGFMDKYTNGYYYGEFFKNAAGILWEPADWAIALSDGFQWYDSAGMLPLIPAAWGDNIARAATRFIPAGWSDEAGNAIGHWVSKYFPDDAWARYHLKLLVLKD